MSVNPPFFLWCFVFLCKGSVLFFWIKNYLNECGETSPYLNWSWKFPEFSWPIDSNPMPYTDHSRSCEWFYISCYERMYTLGKTFPYHTYPLINKQKEYNNRIWSLVWHVYKYTLKLFCSQCILLYSSDLISINSRNYVTLYTFSYPSWYSPLFSCSYSRKPLVLFFEIFLGDENCSCWRAEYFFRAFFPMDSDRWDDYSLSIFTSLWRYWVVGEHPHDISPYSSFFLRL